MAWRVEGVVEVGIYQLLDLLYVPKTRILMMMTKMVMAVEKARFNIIMVIVMKIIIIVIDFFGSIAVISENAIKM